MWSVNTQLPRKSIPRGREAGVQGILTLALNLLLSGPKGQCYEDLPALHHVAWDLPAFRYQLTEEGVFF